MKKLGFGIGLTALAVLLVSACGGTSERNGAIFTEGGSAGSGGTAQGGEVDSAGAPGNETGGSVTNGGKGNTAGSGMTTGGTSPGLGGAPDFVPPDPTVKEGCKAYCEGVVAAACDATTVDDCTLGCRAISGSPTCNRKYRDLLFCAQGKTFTCNKDGDAIPEGCQVPYAQAALCVLGNPDETLAKPCKAYCDAAEAAACTNTTPSGECAYGCEVTSSLIPQCAADWKTFVDCAATADVTCNDSGDPSPNACAPQYLKYLACFLEAGQ